MHKINDMEDKIIKLKENIFYRAKIFIEDARSFAPFGAKLYNNAIKDIMAYEEFDDSIKGDKLINIMKFDILSELNEGLIQAGAIAYDVIIELANADGILQRRDALCLIVTTDGQHWDQDYYPYMIINNQCFWK